MAYFYGLIFLLLSAIHTDASAAFPASPKQFQVRWDACGGPTSYGASAQEACSGVAALASSCDSSQKWSGFTLVSNGGNCSATGDKGGKYTGPISETNKYTCPSNSTLSGNMCSCNADYVQDGNQCKPKPDEDPCELLATMCSGSQGMSTNFSIPGQKAGISFTCMAPPAIGTDNPLPGCSNGCMAQVGGFTTAFQSDSGSWMTQGTAKFVGSTCVPSVINDLNAEADPEYEPDPDPKTTEQPNSSCPNGFPGTVNGVSVCVPPKASSGTTELETKDNGDGTKTNSKTDVKCSNGKCEVTKTSTTTNTTTGGTVHSSSVTTTVDKAAFCSQNKTAGACKDEKGDNEDGNGSFTGNCDSGFQCKGDAITCAIAKKQHQDYCEALKSPEHAAYVAAKATTGKVTGDLEGNQTIDLMQRFTSGADDFIGSGSCPPDRRIALLYGELVIPYSQLCPWLAILGNILVIVSCIAGARIIIGRYS